MLQLRRAGQVDGGSTSANPAQAIWSRSTPQSAQLEVRLTPPNFLQWCSRARAFAEAPSVASYQLDRRPREVNCRGFAFFKPELAS
ncbi:hypothetical protein [Nannocystis punicea]|uniref:Uncharacterized protein n=1 Tax=Nannocystis punicea TaxID=2995304 RepID=A0ABY7H3S5_9BACT|nr:hypothetical protein [Nannocystis poenicansa]WAS93938.1 hypothetical protein O0S08_48015 [Nannocystis poenicansa]